jgi:hypothetical protein
MICGTWLRQPISRTALAGGGWVCRHVVYIQAEGNRAEKSTLSYTRQHVAQWMDAWFTRLGFHQAGLRLEQKDSRLKKEAFVIESFRHIWEKRALRSSPPSFTSRRTLVRRILSKSMVTVSRLMGQKEEDSVGSFLGFSMDSTRRC